uniref:EamA domain-containing protein n=1 Tax=Chromera velia CCMP2878 TaxID=1169474 RepID=A0A0G4HFR3_9ALVE|mmetsp:Transcript_17594/g.35707  ORF Transcript_17594/g.35707 Transcript_17594/m.35707 type:complete len:527 (-) Transcript_17594:106-1686(-)|eukprot:Cvel_26971.t1-p1 / transcript=Cvel_26971.t1 / gene=Cvel_26971 / organism=Chromera_velia_CCMP2878 / gene_product=Solute carrier family 35 member G1, putative / transcript_product=Solute carrier family 35 member G1, putative / location=Cvel_scaffold3290:6858-9340(+) / protein_length=526 / sequence_SO=supercontig / SO=protein_coding / is_pseudo=false
MTSNSGGAVWSHPGVTGGEKDQLETGKEGGEGEIHHERDDKASVSAASVYLPSRAASVDTCVHSRGTERSRDGKGECLDLELGQVESSSCSSSVEIGFLPETPAGATAGKTECDAEREDTAEEIGGVGTDIVKAGRGRMLFRSVLGLFLASAGAVAFALLSLSVEITMPHVGNRLQLLICARSLVQGLLCISSFYASRKVLKCLSRGKKSNHSSDEKGEVEEQEGGFFGPKEDRFLLFMRGLLSGIAINCMLFTLTQLPMGDASAIHFSGPLITAALARVWLKESWHWMNWVAGVLSITGIMFIANPPFLAPVFDFLGFPPAPLDSHDVPLVPRPVAVAIGVAGAVSSAVGLTILRKIRRVSFAANVLSTSVVSFLIALVILLVWEKHRPTIEDLKNIDIVKGWGGTVLVGFCGFSAQSLMALGFQFEKAGPAVFALCLEVFVAFLLQVAVMKTAVGLGSLLGGILVVVSVTLLFAVKLCTASSPSSPKKQKENCESDCGFDSAKAQSACEGTERDPREGQDLPGR